MKLVTSYDPFYPDDDGEPMSDNTLQAQWINVLFNNLVALYRNDPNTFVAYNHLIYPVRGDNKTRLAPDVYAAFGRPKGHRGSYKVWDEGGVFPQVVFEVMSPGNRAGEMARKLDLYDRFGAEEYYNFDPDRMKLEIYLRDPSGRLARLAEPERFISPLLNVYFELGDDLTVTGPNGEAFLSFEELADRAEAEAAAARREVRRADTAVRRAEFESRRAEEDRRRAETETARLRAALRAAGIDPDTV